MAVAFFDLDKTLLSVNSATLWVRYELRHKHLKLSQALRAMGWLIRYRLGDADLDAPIRYSIGTLLGSQAAVLAERTRAFYAAEVRHRYRPGALSALAAHRAQGDRIVLLSSTTEYLANAVAKDIAFDAILCTRFEVAADGTFTGRPIEPLCFGQGKLAQAEALLAQWQVPMADCVFYSDSNADMPVFQAVGRPVAVNPDPKLSRQAKRRGWERVDWGRPARPRGHHFRGQAEQADAARAAEGPGPAVVADANARAVPGKKARI